MAALTKRAMIHDPEGPFLPDHILDHMILPRLPFKILKRFQCISKRYRSLIAHDIPFASRQALLLSPSSSVVMQFANSALSFPTNPEFVGLPDISLKFLGDLQSYRLLCSTNGLFLFVCFDDCSNGLYLCNPATQEKGCVLPGPLRHALNMGLAFDPSSPNRYKIVNPFIEYKRNSPLDYYQFNVFRSETGQWSLSKEKLYVRNPSDFSFKTVYTRGFIYWHFGKCILWYNTEKDSVGSVRLSDGPWSVNVYEGWVMCCRSTDIGLEVWRLTTGTQLDILYCFSWDDIGLPHDLYQMRRSCVEDVKEFDNGPPFNPRSWLRCCFPVAFDGQFVYLVDPLQSEVRRGILWGYNTCTRQLDKKGMMAIQNKVQHALLDYHNSLVPVPKILQ